MGLKLEAFIGLNSEQFEKGIDRTKDKTAEMVKNFAIGAIGVATLEQAFEKTIETAKDLVNESRRLGIGVEQLQVMKKAAEDTGVEFESLATSMEKLNEFRAKAIGGGAQGNEALRQAKGLGMNREQLQSMSAQDLIFGPIRQKILSVNPQELAAPIKEILGKGGTAIIPALSANLGEIHDKMESLGMIMSDKTATDLNALAVASDGVKGIFINALAPALVALAEQILDMASNGSKFSQMVESALFLVGKGTAESKMPSYVGPDGKTYSGTERAQQASDAISKFEENRGLIQKNNIYGLKGSELNDVAANMTIGDFKKTGVFGDYTGNSAKDFEKYTHGLMAPEHDAVADASKSSSAAIDGIRDWLDKLKNGTAGPAKSKDPNFPNDPKNKPESRNYKAPEDALVRVGNFLGSSRGVINGAQARLEQHAAATASNTQQMVGLLKTIAGKGSNPLPTSSALDVQFPAS